MKNRILKPLIIALSMLSMGTFAQDAHFSQWQENAVVLNPAEAGNIKNGEMRIFASYRNQWGKLGSGITSTAISFDMKKGKSKMTYGGYLLSNNLADIFQNTTFVGGAAYEITNPSNRKYHITTGIQIGAVYKRFDQNKLTFDSQYDNGNFDDDLPSGENFVVESKVMPETSVGFLYYNTNKKNKFKPYGGFSVSHLAKQNMGYAGMISPMPIKWSFYGGSSYEIDKWKKLTPYVLYAKQGAATEIFGGLSFDYTFNVDFTAQLDLGYRAKDAAIIQLGMKIKDNWYRVGYDINTSPIKDFVKGSSALEFSVSFIPKGRFF